MQAGATPDCWIRHGQQGATGRFAVACIAIGARGMLIYVRLTGW